jgi:outer membrane protein OmpA-like peptidoglycan-associated protein
VRPRRAIAPRRKAGELWAVIYIDLMTQIMAFFVIVWAVDLNDKETATPQVATGMGLGIGDQSVRMVDLPGDVLFGSGKVELGAEGRTVIDRLFGEKDSGVLEFDQGGLATRKLVIHGHTDDAGKKDENFLLGYQRAWAVYQEIRSHSRALADHVVLCTHADNTPSQLVALPADNLQLTDDEREVIRQARAKNRRITIEDLVVAAPAAPAAPAAETAPAAAPTTPAVPAAPAAPTGSAPAAPAAPTGRAPAAPAAPAAAEEPPR